jgi:hypothetical protein
MTEKKTSDYISSPLQKTPIADMFFIYLGHADTKFGDPKYGFTLVLDSKVPEHLQYLEALNKLNDTVGQELLKGITKGRNAFRVKDVCKAEEDDDGNLTGRYFLKCVSKQKRPVLDSKGQIIPDDLLRKIGSGSKGRAILSIKKSIASQHKTVGITMYLDKVQIVSVVEYTGGNGGSGFDTVDGGFTADIHPAIDGGNSGVNF